MEKHITVVGTLQIGLGILGILVGFITLVVLLGAGVISRDAEAVRILSMIGPAIATYLFVVNIPSIIGGIGLLKKKSWARILVLIISAMDLLAIPIGTALAVYSIWVLVQDETAQIFSSAGKSSQAGPSGS